MDIKKLVKSIAIPLIVGIIVSLIMMPFNDYKDLIQHTSARCSLQSQRAAFPR